MIAKEEQNEQTEASCFADLKMLLEQNCSRNLSTKYVAQEIGISENNCVRLFRKYMNMTPAEYLRQYRIELACQLLTLTNKSIKEISRKCGLNFSYLSHAFKKEYGLSPINYMITRRIDESKYLLAETDLSLSQIAQLLGFSSLSYFSQVFRKTQNVSPMEFRQNSRSK